MRPCSTFWQRADGACNDPAGGGLIEGLERYVGQDFFSLSGTREKP